MKKIVYILGIICAMIMQSCLDLEPKTQLADTNYWKSPEHFKLFATQFYGWSADFRWLDDSQHADIRSDLFAGSTVNIYSNEQHSVIRQALCRQLQSYSPSQHLVATG